MEGHSSGVVDDLQGTLAGKDAGGCGSSLEYRSISATSFESIEEPRPEERALEAFHRYLEMVETSGVAIRKKDGSGGAIIPSRFNSRYFEEGRANIKKKLYTRLPKQKGKGLHLTLTVDMKNEGNLIEATANIWKRWKVLRDWLNQRRRRKGEDTLKCVTALEFQKSGAPHLHIYIPLIKWLGPHHVLQAKWGAHLWVKVVPASVAGYVLKYVTKLDETHLHILWASKARLYSVSQDFYTRDWEKGDEWEFIGLVRGELIRHLDQMSPAGWKTRNVRFAGDGDYMLESIWDSICEPP